MIVKVCGITNTGDANTAIEAGATALGFNFYRPSPRYVTPAAARAIMAAVPARVLKVGIFVNEDPSTISAIVSDTGLDIAQTIGASPERMRFWKVFRVRENFSANELNDTGAEAFLLDAASPSLYGGTGNAFDWTLARIPGKRIVLAGGLGPDNVAAAVRACEPWGVDACSRLESQPGRKDPEKVKAFVAAALSV